MKKSKEDLFEFGILNIDKPSGPTSFNISDHVRKVLGLRKTSHFGTLDPKVTGVLPIALNRACKLTGHFIGHDKEYVGIMRFHEEVEIKKVEEIIKEKFLGKIKQTPPVKSRVKRQEREREIKQFKILEKKGKDFLFLAEVQGGTYIRKLVDDLGRELNIGAHMLELRRTRAGIFDESKSLTLYELENAIKENNVEKFIIPGEIISNIYPSYEVKEKEVKKLWTGKPLLEKDIKEKIKVKEGERFCLFNKGKLVGIYTKTNGKDKIAKPDFVLQPIK